jgi:hypothetical protein
MRQVRENGLETISKPHQTPNGSVAALFKMLTYY